MQVSPIDKSECHSWEEGQARLRSWLQKEPPRASSFASMGTHTTKTAPRGASGENYGGLTIQKTFRGVLDALGGESLTTFWDTQSAGCCAGPWRWGFVRHFVFQMCLMVDSSGIINTARVPRLAAASCFGKRSRLDMKFLSSINLVAVASTVLFGDVYGKYPTQPCLWESHSQSFSKIRSSRPNRSCLCSRERSYP